MSVYRGLWQALGLIESDDSICKRGLREEGKCDMCWGYGEVGHPIDGADGTENETCPKCKGTGKP